MEKTTHFVFIKFSCRPILEPNQTNFLLNVKGVEATELVEGWHFNIAMLVSAEREMIKR